MATISLLSVIVAILSTFVVVSSQFANFSKIELPQGITGPESAAFRGLLLLIDGPYTSVYDGRIIRREFITGRFQDFAYTAPGRNKTLCDGTTDPDMGPICGRPSALSFSPTTDLLYIADAYFGLLVAGPLGGLALQLAGGYKFVTGVDVDLTTGNVYFIDASLTYDIRDTTQPGCKPDSTGRLLCYNPVTNRVDVLLTGLSGGGGPAVSRDGTYVLVPELTGNRISKYWLAGPKVNQTEVLLNNVGNPNKIKRAERFGEFWVALSVGFIPPTPLITPQGVRFDSNGVVLQTVSFATQFFNKTISVVLDENRKLYVGSRFTNFIGVYSN
ncbi:protein STRICTOSIDINE SYNTHASE-LIKE 12-like [Bidens hawaiensis]|uniref:protein STRICTOSIDINE SYNTHASE-LIKE 12-like n=1 Tax=Bidens hawaiensis TaxID=980011 RepID=UPI00404AFF22